MKNLLLVCIGVTLGSWVAPAFAERSATFFKTYEAYNAEGKAFLDKIEPRTGTVDLPDGIQLNLKDKFYFLDRDDAIEVLTEAWGNPPSTVGETLGMVFPVELDPIADGNWGIELRMDKMGYVDDKDAASIDYAELLTSMQADTLAANEERKKEGYEPIKLVGWASPPKYDFVNKRLHWAKELQFGDSQNRTLNYDVRFLGREGVFVMSYIAQMKQLSEI